MVLEIVQYGHPALRKKCRAIEEVEDVHRKLAEHLVETMVAANGVGLAAPQVGEEVRMAVVDVSFDPESVTFLKVNGKEAKMEEVMPLVFVNPELEFTGKKVAGEEGCLSIEGIRGEVRRPESVKARLPQLDGTTLVVEADGLLARAIQHETDHLNGILFIDRLSAAGKLAVRRKLRRMGIS